jgi:hypothetical protein
MKIYHAYHLSSRIKNRIILKIKLFRNLLANQQIV